MSKTKKRIIFSSVCVILLLALIGGTFAWFYLNEEVTVSYGNSIFCEAGDSLEISLIEDGTPGRWSSSIDYSTGEYSVVDISGNGYNLYRPGEIDENQQPVSFQQAVSSLESETSFDFIELEVAFRSLSKMNVYLSEDSFIEPVNTENDGTNIYGDFSKDYIAGAMRVAIVDESGVKMIWAPNSHYELVKYPNGTYGFRTDKNENVTPETAYSYYAKDEDGILVENAVSVEEYAAKKFVVDSTNAKKGNSGNSAVLVSLNPAEEGAYAEETVKIRIWFEGTDREAHQALSGGNVNVKLKFVGIYKEEADAQKQAALDAITYNQSTFSGVSEGMVFSTDGRNWTKCNAQASNLPTLKSGESIFFKYPETVDHFETNYIKFTKD